MSRRTLYTEPFTHADENPLSLGGTWSTYVGLGNMQIVSNRCICAATATQCRMTYTGAMPNDQWCQVDIPTFTIAADAPILQLRYAAPNTGNGYIVYGGFGLNITIAKDVGGTASDLAAGSIAIAQGDTILFEAIGTTLNAYINGVLGATVVDATYASGRVGLGGYATLTTQLEYDNFLAGDFTSAFQPALARRSNILIGAGRGM